MENPTDRQNCEPPANSPRTPWYIRLIPWLITGLVLGFAMAYFKR
jgi:hypothetical protein